MTDNQMSYALYAVPSDDIESIREAVENILKIKMRLVLSGAWGDYYIHDGEGFYDPSISVY